MSATRRILQELEDREEACREHARLGDGWFGAHVLPWRTPAGSGWDGCGLRLTDRGWVLVTDPGGPAWPTVAAHLRSWWRPYDAARAALDAVARTMQRHHVRLWCLCPGAVGWGEFHEASSPAEAVARALDDTPTCARCHEVFASCGQVRQMRRDFTESEATRE